MLVKGATEVISDPSTQTLSNNDILVPIMQLIQTLTIVIT